VQVRGGRSGSSVVLERGEVLLDAANGSSRPARVETPQFQVETRGGAVSVVRGLRGAEVRVLSGEAEIVQAGLRRHLRAGEGFSSEGSTPIPVVERVAWTSHGRALAAGLPASSITATAHLSPYGAHTAVTTDYLPQSTLAIVEAPSLGTLLKPTGISSLEDLLRPGVAEDLLGKVQGSNLEPGHIQAIGQFLDLVRYDSDVQALLRALSRSATIGFAGESVVAIFDVSSEGEAVQQAFEVRLAPLLAAFDPEGELPIRVAVANGFLALGTRGTAMDETVAALEAGQPTEFAYSPFMLEVRNTSPEADFTAALSVRSLVELGGGFDTDSRQGRILSRLGLLNMSSVIAANDFGDQARNQALRVTFDGTRDGVAGWLDEPGPLGALQFFSPDTHGLLALRVESPAVMLEEVFSWLAADHEQWRVPRTEPELELLRRVAATLGNEVAVGLDNPVLPVPHVKVAVEVLDPEGFHDTMLELLETVWSKGGEAARITTRSDDHRGRLVVTFEHPEAPFALSYAIVDDFVVFGPGPAFVRSSIDAALDDRSLDNEYAFIQSLPSRSGSHVSALFYQAFNDSAKQLLPYLERMLPEDSRGDFIRQLRESDRGALVTYAVAGDNAIDFFVEGVRVGEYRMTGLLPTVAEWYSKTAGALNP
jgi:hypothetical protein